MHVTKSRQKSERRRERKRFLPEDYAAERQTPSSENRCAAARESWAAAVRRLRLLETRRGTTLNNVGRRCARDARAVQQPSNAAAVIGRGPPAPPTAAAERTRA